MNLLSMSLTAGVLIILIVLVRALAIHKVPKTVFLILWGVALLRLLIPGTLSPLNWLSKIGLIQPNRTATTGAQFAGPVGGAAALSEPTIVNVLENARDLGQSAARTLLAQNWPYAVWGFGIGCLATYFAFCYLRSRRVLNMAIPVKRIKLTARRGRRRVRVCLSDQISTPLTYGVLNPRIVLPKAMLTVGRARLGYALRHEMAHIERFDMVFKALLLLCVCVHWFNPLVWVMYFLACRDIELSCDEKVIRSSKRDRRRDYAMTLIELEEGRGLAYPLSAAFARNAIEERVVSIMKSRKSSVPAVIGAVALVCLSLTVFADAELASTQSAEVFYVVTGEADASGLYTLAEDNFELPVEIVPVESAAIVQSDTATSARLYRELAAQSAAADERVSVTYAWNDEKVLDRSTVAPRDDDTYTSATAIKSYDIILSTPMFSIAKIETLTESVDPIDYGVVTDMIRISADHIERPDGVFVEAAATPGEEAQAVRDLYFETDTADARVAVLAEYFADLNS